MLTKMTGLNAVPLISLMCSLSPRKLRCRFALVDGLDKEVTMLSRLAGEVKELVRVFDVNCNVLYTYP
jgi:hypothetical protein